MPSWAGKWKGGRYYLDERGQRVFFIESNRRGIPNSIRLQTHDEEIANGQLGHFRADPAGFLRALAPPIVQAAPDAVTITADRLKIYEESIHGCVLDHRKARRADLIAWANYTGPDGKPLDLRAVDKRALRIALASFAPDGSTDRRRTGGFRRRAESLNAFCNFLVAEGDLQSWSRLGIAPSQKPKATRAERVAYTPDEVRERWLRIPDRAVRDVLHLRTATGMHDTEVQQLEGARLYTGPLPDRGTGIRVALDRGHEVAGVLQFRQKTKPRHRVSVDRPALEAALRLVKGVPSRFDTYNACREVGLVPSNLRHTYTTLRGVGRIVHYEEGGVSLDQVAEILGHRVGSAMTGSRYDKLQVPPMMRIPLEWPEVGISNAQAARG